MQKTLCELFAGVGGFRVGLERANKGWKTVWASQWEPGKKLQHAYYCYVSHFGDFKYMNTDIHEVVENHMDNIPMHNLLVGGFPCQDYSVARTGAKGIQGKKGVLWRDIQAILKAKRPAFVLLENVDRLLKSPSSQRGRDFGIILSCFYDLGYTVERRVINAAEYGFVQRRRRTFIFACRNDTKYAKSINNKTFNEILHKDGFFYKEFPIKKTPLGVREHELKYKDIVDVSDRFAFEFGNSGVMKDGVIHTEDVECNYKGEYTYLKHIVQDNADVKYRIKQDLNKWTYLKGPKDIVRKVGTPQEYHFREGGIAFPDSLDRPARTMLTSEGSLNRSTHVVQDKKGEYRILTPIETERINGFPDDWTNTGMPEKFRYFCMGNALVVHLIEKMGKRFNTIFKNED